jgi:hypothetical protein
MAANARLKPFICLFASFLQERRQYLLARGKFVILHAASEHPFDIF